MKTLDTLTSFATNHFVKEMVLPYFTLTVKKGKTRALFT